MLRLTLLLLQLMIPSDQIVARQLLYGLCRVEPDVPRYALVEYLTSARASTIASILSNDFRVA